MDTQWRAGQVSDRAAADWHLKEWQREMPQVPSAYQPSGVLPGLATLTMSVGAMLGAVVGAGLILVGAALIAGIGALLLFTIVLAGLLSIPVAILGLLILFAAACGAGYLAAQCTTRAGHFASNRNRRAAILFAAASGTFAGCLSWVAFYFVRNLPSLAETKAFGPQVAGLDTLPLVVFGLCALTAAIMAGCHADERVVAAKFCEECGLYLDKSVQATFSLTSMKHLAEALRNNELPKAFALVRCPTGNDGCFELHVCSGCSRGFADLRATFKAHWKEENEDKEISESWLIASVPVPAEQSGLFRESSRLR